RAVALSAKLPQRERQMVLAGDASYHAQFGEARRLLEGLVAADSNDVEALTALVGIEMSDPILVPVPGGQRPRGSLNRAARLAELVKADSLGFQSPTWSMPAQRMVYLGRSGRIADAARLADSLVAAGFFANPTAMLANQAASSWAFALSLYTGRIPRAAALMD